MKIRGRRAYLLTLACGLAGCKDVASTVVEKGVSAAKDVTKGVEEGVDKGRKTGESGDGATVVTTSTELGSLGTVAIYSVRRASESNDTEITLAFENTTAKPLRITKLRFVALDDEGFAKSPSDAASELTVAPKSKSKLSFHVPEKADKLSKIRVWDKDLAIEASARK